MSAILFERVAPAGQGGALVIQLLMENLVGHVEQGFLFLAQETGVVYLEVSNKISGVAAAAGREARTGQPDLTGGGGFRQQGFLDTAQGGNIHHATGKHPEDADRQVHVDVPTFEAKERMGPGVQDEVEVARLPVFGRGATLTGNTEFLARHHRGRNADRELPVLWIPATAFTVGATVVGEVPLAHAGRTGYEATFAADASAAVAGTAHGRPAVAASSTTLAGRTSRAPLQGNRYDATKRGFLEIQFHIKAVVIALRTPSRGLILSVRRGVGFPQPGEMLEGLPCKAELLVGLGIGVAVRVPAHGQPLEGALDLGRAGTGGDPQNLVEIGLGHFSILIGTGRLMAETGDAWVNVGVFRDVWGWS